MDAGATLARLAGNAGDAARMGIRARILLLKRAGDAAPLARTILEAAGIASEGRNTDIGAVKVSSERP